MGCQIIRVLSTGGCNPARRTASRGVMFSILPLPWTERLQCCDSRAGLWEHRQADTEKAVSPSDTAVADCFTVARRRELEMLCLGTTSSCLSLKPVAKLQSKSHVGDADSVPCLGRRCVSPVKWDRRRSTGCPISSPRTGHLPGQRRQNLNLQLNLWISQV